MRILDYYNPFMVTKQKDHSVISDTVTQYATTNSDSAKRYRGSFNTRVFLSKLSTGETEKQREIDRDV